MISIQNCGKRSAWILIFLTVLNLIIIKLQGNTATLSNSNKRNISEVEEPNAEFEPAVRSKRSKTCDLLQDLKVEESIDFEENIIEEYYDEGLHKGNKHALSKL